MNQPNKDAVRGFWDEAPCGTRELDGAEDDALFLELERQRDEREPFIGRFARFDEHRGQRVLEVGVGAGTDHLRFARAAAVCAGVDLTESGIAMTKRRLAREGLASELRVSDAEHLPFEDARFDFVYSWGVIHHTPDTNRAAAEILRVLKPGGQFCVMVYNRRSLLALQAWLVFGVAKGRPFVSVDEILANHVESPGTKAYSAEGARALFEAASVAQVTTVVTPYDVRVGRRRFLPPWLRTLVPRRWGWFHVVTGTK